MTTRTHDHVETMERLQLAFQQFALIAALVDDADVRASQDAVSMADSVGFLVDPTRYQQALSNGSLKRQRELLDLFAETKARLKVLFPAGWEA